MIGNYSTCERTSTCAIYDKWKNNSGKNTSSVIHQKDDKSFECIACSDIFKLNKSNPASIKRGLPQKEEIFVLGCNYIRGLNQIQSAENSIQKLDAVKLNYVFNHFWTK